MFDYLRYNTNFFEKLNYIITVPESKISYEHNTYNTS